MLGALLLLAGAMLKFSFSVEASYVYAAGAVLFAVMQFLGRVRGGSRANVLSPSQRVDSGNVHRCLSAVVHLFSHSART